MTYEGLEKMLGCPKSSFFRIILFDCVWSILFYYDKEHNVWQISLQKKDILATT
jgi:hypothetical protein